MGGRRRPRVFVDAGVIYSKTLRDWLGLYYTCNVSAEPPFDVHWSDDVLAEAISRLRDNNPTWSGGRIARISELITQTFEVGRVREYSVVESNYQGADQGDAHVHAAASACAADYLLTTNDRDFRISSEAQDKLPYEILSPDDFFMTVALSNPEGTAACIERQIAYRNGRGEEANLCEALQKAGCPRFADHVLKQLRLMARAGL